MRGINRLAILAAIGAATTNLQARFSARLRAAAEDHLYVILSRLDRVNELASYQAEMLIGAI
ncbi:MAG: hypothetical protein M0Z99_33870 [Betaproteobacteria bacterium]|nr:hypothetical protein [Betaproteobacteria bacterium]